MLRKLVQLYLSQDRLTEAHALVIMLRQHDYPIDVVTFNLIMSAYKRARNFEAVIFLMDQMRRYDIVLDSVSYNIVIDSCGKSQNLSLAFQLYDRMIQEQLEPGVNTYTSLIDACGKVNQLEDAYKLLLIMHNKGVQPNAHTFTTLINSCAQVKNIEVGILVLDILKKNESVNEIGQSIVVPLTTLVRACIIASNLDMAFRVLDTMLDVGIHPNPIAFNSIVEGCCRKLQLSSAIRVVRLMYHHQVPPNATTYNMILGTSIECNMLNEALDIIREMLACNLPPYEQLLNKLLNLCSDCIDLAAQVLDLMNCFHTTPNPAILCKILKLYSDCGQINMALQEWERTRHQNEVVPSSICIEMLKICICAHSISYCDTILEELCNSPFAIKIPELIKLVDLCAVNQQYELAMGIHSYLKSRNIIITYQLYRSLIAVSLKCLQWQQAEAFVQDMQAAGLEPEGPITKVLLAECKSRDHLTDCMPLLLREFNLEQCRNTQDKESG